MKAAPHFSEETLEEIVAEAARRHSAFSKSSFFQQLTEEQQLMSEDVVELFSECMYLYEGAAPGEWGLEALDKVCLHEMPAQVVADKALFKAVAPVLSAFFSFLAHADLDARAGNMIPRLEEIGPKIVRNSQDKSHWGMAKTFTMQAWGEGVDIDDPAQVGAFLEQYNAAVGA